jgi:RNA methyltransferase, TrmH family
VKSGRRATEVKIYGRNACRAVFTRRPEEVDRVYLVTDLLREFAEPLRERAERRLPYKVVTAEELEAITESKHHEGICVVARPRPEPTSSEILSVPGPALLVALADVGNPHNVGAILRTAAHFGARAALLGGLPGARLSSAAHRTAQGGAEWLDVVGVDDLPDALRTCRHAGFSVCATSSHAEEGRDLFSERLPTRAVLLLGSEGEGLPPDLMQEADLLLTVPGTGHVESLNVAAAAAVLLGEFWRQGQSKGR